MADGTKSSDHQVAQKKKVKSETKPGAKRESAAAKEKPKAKPAAKPKSVAKKESDDDLDIEGSESQVEDSN